MAQTQTSLSETTAAIFVALSVLLSCWGLFYLDHETQGFADLLKPGNLIALSIYFIPTFFLTFFLFLVFSNKKSQATSMLLALAIGIPVSFALIIAFFLAIR